jgi:hypothetical protein
VQPTDVEITVTTYTSTVCSNRIVALVGSSINYPDVIIASDYFYENRVRIELLKNFHIGDNLMAYSILLHSTAIRMVNTRREKLYGDRRRYEALDLNELSNEFV